MLADALKQAGRDVVWTREPGGTVGAEALRGLLLRVEQQWTPLAELLLHFAARADHVEKTIRPALARGADVVCDRFTDSTVAYQGYGQGADLELIGCLHAQLKIEPDLTFVLRVTPEVAHRRLVKRPSWPDRYDLAGEPFQDRVRAGFDAVAAAAPSRCVLVDGEGAAEAVHAIIWSAVAARW